MVVDSEPSGDVSRICWEMMSAIAGAAGLVIAWLTKRLDASNKEVSELHAARLQDRKDFEAQTNLLVNAVLKKKGGTSP